MAFFPGTSSFYSRSSGFLTPFHGRVQDRFSRVIPRTSCLRCRKRGEPARLRVSWKISGLVTSNAIHIPTLLPRVNARRGCLRLPREALTQAYSARGVSVRSHERDHRGSRQQLSSKARIRLHEILNTFLDY